MATLARVKRVCGRGEIRWIKEIVMRGERIAMLARQWRALQKQELGYTETK